jgi:hypothetical protein
MKLDFEGRTWSVDIDDLSVKQALAITSHSGGTLTAWEKSLAEVESPNWLPAMECLYWLMLAQNGDTTSARPGDTDFAVLKFSKVFADALAAEAGPEKAEDPTKPPARPVPSPAAVASRGKTPAAG